jgi:N-acetylmuramoyl-L-alanine amidase
MHDPSTYCYDEWQAVDYRAVASPAGAVAVLGGDHLFSARRWQVWKSSATPGQGPPLWEKPYKDGNSQLLIKAVNDDGIAAGERISGTDTYWGQIDSVVVKNGEETILPESSGAFTFGASLCQINENDPDSRSRLAVGGSSLWVEKENAWHLAEHPPTMANIIAIAKNGVMLGTRTIWRNGISIPLDKLVESQKINPTNPAPRYTNLRAYAMNGEGAIVALADDANAPSPIPNGKALLLLNPVEVQELSPKLRDDDDKEIKGSEKPAKAPKSTEMVERDPSSLLNDASEIRIAWRDMKVKVGKHLVGKKVTWTMTPEFTPIQENGTPEAKARFRGKWDTAKNSIHRDAFSKSEKYGENGWLLVAPTSGSISGSATTTVDSDGYTAIRVNLPPIGFNKARVKVNIDGVVTAIDLIELEVPAVIVIDPGHGTGANQPGSNAFGATANDSKTEEHAFAMDIAQQTLQAVRKHAESKRKKIEVLLTRKNDKNISAVERTKVAKEHGCDVYISIHFNGSPDRSYRDPFGMWDNTKNLNPSEDRALATRLRKAVEIAILDVDPVAFRKKEVRSTLTGEYWENNTAIWKGLDTCSDEQIDKDGKKHPYNGNTPNYTPCRAALIEVEWMSNSNADALFNSAPLMGKMRATTAAKLADACITDVFVQPTKN